MGLLDQVIGSVTGTKTDGSSPMSPLVKALLLMLAAKAAHDHFGKSHETVPSAPQAPSAPSGKIESGMLAGLPSLDSLLDTLKGKGHEDKVHSWIGTGPNKAIDAKDLDSALGPEAMGQLQTASGLPRDKLLQQLSTALPQVVDKLTPDGRLPASHERSHW